MKRKVNININARKRRVKAKKDQYQRFKKEL